MNPLNLTTEIISTAILFAISLFASFNYALTNWKKQVHTTLPAGVDNPTTKIFIQPAVGSDFTTYKQTIGGTITSSDNY